MEDVEDQLRHLKVDLGSATPPKSAGLLMDTLVLLKKEHGPAGVGVLRIAVRSNTCR